MDNYETESVLDSVDIHDREGVEDPGLLLFARLVENEATAVRTEQGHFKTLNYGIDKVFAHHLQVLEGIWIQTLVIEVEHQGYE